jgi:hypothetical protein
MLWLTEIKKVLALNSAQIPTIIFVTEDLGLFQPVQVKAGILTSDRPWSSFSRCIK